jgi:hypothetical protein
MQLAKFTTSVLKGNYRYISLENFWFVLNTSSCSKYETQHPSSMCLNFFQKPPSSELLLLSPGFLHLGQLSCPLPVSFTNTPLLLSKLCIASISAFSKLFYKFPKHPCSHFLKLFCLPLLGYL